MYTLFEWHGLSCQWVHDCDSFMLFSFLSAKISTLKAEISLLKDECDYLNKGIEEMKCAAMSCIHTAPAVSCPSGWFLALLLLVPFRTTCFFCSKKNQ